MRGKYAHFLFTVMLLFAVSDARAQVVFVPAWQGLTCALPWGGIISAGSSVTTYLNASEPCGSSCASQTRTCSGNSLTGNYSNSSCSVQGCCVPSWTISSYGSCSVSCGGGTQPVNYSDGCGGTFTSSQSCNTQACVCVPNGSQSTVNSTQYDAYGCGFPVWDVYDSCGTLLYQGGNDQSSYTYNQPDGAGCSYTMQVITNYCGNFTFWVGAISYQCP